MKAFEVLTVNGKLYFIEASSKKELASLNGVKRIHAREDMTPDECPMEISGGVIAYK